MKFVTHNQKEIYVSGSYQGEIDADFSVLKKLFGKPHIGDDYKTDAEWEIEFEDGTTAAIYNWKNGKSYCGEDGIPKTKITRWHIGGNDVSIVQKIQSIIIHSSYGIKF